MRLYTHTHTPSIQLINGDCYEKLKDIPDKSIDCVYVDIPYLIAHGGSGKSPLALRIHREFSKDLKEIKDGIDYSILDEFARVSKKINCFIWCSKEQIYELLKYFIYQRCKFEILAWCKTNPTPATNNVWLPDIEYCLYFREKGVKLNNGYDLKHKWYASPLNVADKKKYNHPTIKPLELVKRHLEHVTQEGDTVLDCFMGSGTTGVACKELGRNFIGIEIDPEYFKIASERISQT